jgi:hypothetical protein
MTQDPHGMLDSEASRAPFLDRFLPRMLANTFAMAGVALATWWLVDGQNAAHEQALTDARDQAQLMQHERDRMSDLNRELAREVHDAGVASEIARWQLRWTEERLRRVEGEQGRAASAQRRVGAGQAHSDSSKEADPSGLRLPPKSQHVALQSALAGDDGAAWAPAPGAWTGSAEGTDEPTVQVLDAPAAAFLSDRVDAIEGRAWDEANGDDGGHADPREGGGHDLSSGRGLGETGLGSVAFDPAIPSLRRHNSQLGRDRALSVWKGILKETARAECANRFTETARWRCEDEISRALWQYSGLGVNCILTGNAVPDYVAGLSMDNLPSDSVPLERGALMLCDGALANM